VTGAVPETMTVVEISAAGGPEMLRTARRPVPAPGHGEALIRVAAAGVNRPDVMQRAGQYPPPPGASDLPGLEVAGEVARVGPGVAASLAGAQVCALTAGGGYAEYCLAPADQCLPVPAGLDVVQAAALPETFFTVWTNLFERARLGGGESFLVHGGSSGIGTTAIQLAEAFGARVFATAGSAEKCRVCEDLGAERAIDYKAEDFVAAVKAATGGRGVDVILDMVGAAYLARNIAALADDGRLVVIGFMGGVKAELDLVAVLRRRLTVTGSALRPRSLEAKARIAAALKAHVWPLIESGRVRPLIHKTFPLADAAQAHALMESSTHVGKIVLTT
jgi:NADPH2:quinone reductase